MNNTDFYIPVIEIVTSMKYYDPAKGTTRTEETTDGHILKNGGVPKHPVWLVGKRVTLRGYVKTATQRFGAEGQGV